jgi:hypothetical protein
MSSDNIEQAPAEAAPAPVEAGASPAPTETQPAPPAAVPAPELFNIAEAFKMVSKHYERDFPKMTFNTPQQITDGCIVEFVDSSMGVTVATARVRVRNRLVVNNETGDMFLLTQLSDLAYSRSVVPLSVK